MYQIKNIIFAYYYSLKHYDKFKYLVSDYKKEAIYNNDQLEFRDNKGHYILLCARSLKYSNAYIYNFTQDITMPLFVKFKKLNKSVKMEYIKFKMRPGFNRPVALLPTNYFCSNKIIF